ncbi:MAG: sulfate adenylyltransferase [Candidatus Omnitrophica bacterium]|nr:sulfate adenylyltransferase [Candidatus Omnitrophota bacterium]
MNKKPLSSKNSFLVKLKVSQEILMDAEQIAIGGYAPVDGFMGKADFESVLNNMRLVKGDVWTLPIVLDISKKEAASIKIGDEILLGDGQDQENFLFSVEDIYEHDKSLYCDKVYGTKDVAHSGVAKVLKMGEVLVGGRVISVLNNFDFDMRKFTMTPKETKAQFEKNNWKTVVAFHTRNVVHRAHEYLQRCAMEYADGILIHPAVGFTKPGDFKKELIIKGYQSLIDNYYPKNKALLSALGIGMKFAGPREAVFHALVRKNYGCTHIIIGRDHAGVGGYYEKYAGHKIFSSLPSLGITPLLFKGPFYCNKCEAMATESTCSHDESYRSEVSGTLARKFIKEKKKLPKWLMRPEIANLLEDLGESVFS